MDLLNLDELAVVKREVTIAGRAYAVADQTVGQMMETARLTKKFQETDDAEVIFEQMIRTAQSVVPDCPESVLRNLKVTQLNALFNFAMAQDEEVVAAAKQDKEVEAESVKK